MAIDCNLPHKFAKQNAKRRLVDEGLIDKFNTILDYPKLLKRIGEFNNFAKSNYGIDGKFVQVDDVNGTNKVIFNEAAFRAIDVMKGVIPHNTNDTNTSGYLNQVRPDYSPDFDPNQIFNPFDSHTPEGDTIPRTGLTQIVSLKQNLLDRAQKQLGDLNRKIEESKGDITEYNKLVGLRTQLRNYIGEEGVSGLKKEISDISKIDSRAPEIIAPYIEKEFDRLGTLIKSSNPEHLNEAKDIIKFIKRMGDFNPITIRQDPNGHPIYDTSELFNEDNQLLLTPTMIKYFKDWSIRADIYKDSLDAQGINVIEQSVGEHPKVQKMYPGEKLDYEKLFHTKTGLKDINWVDMTLMDMSNGIFSHNGIVPQVVKMNLDDFLERHKSWSKAVETRTDELSSNLDKELIKLGYTQDRLGFIGIHRPDYGIFFQHTPDGAQVTRDWAQKYSYTYLDKYEDMNHKFQNEKTKAYNFPDETMRDNLVDNVYKKRNAWLKRNTLTVDPARLSEITNDPQFKDLEGNFKFSPEQQVEHEQQIKSLVGDKYYQKIIESQQKKVRDYMVQANNFQSEQMEKESVSTPEELSQSAKDQFQIWKSKNSPFVASDSMRLNLPSRINGRNYHPSFDYSDHIPLRVDVEGRDLNHYDSNYETIEKNSILSEFHDFLTKTLKEMYSRYSYDEQKQLNITSVPLAEKKRMEIFLDPKLNFYQAISAVFRDWWDHFKGGFGVRQQDIFNYAKKDPNTGEPAYKVNDNFIKQNLHAINDLFKVKSTKFLNEYNINKTDENKLEKINKFSSIPTQVIDNYTLNLINKFTGKEYSTQELKQQYGNHIPIGKIIFQNAQHEIVQDKSIDLPTILKYYTHLTAQYAARQEILPWAELIKRNYEQIHNIITQNTNDPTFDAKTNNSMTQGLRTNANQQFDNQFERTIIGQQGLVKHFGIMKAGDKLTPEEEKNYLKRFFNNIVLGKGFDGKIFDIQDKKVLSQIDEALSGLGKSEEDQKTRAELEEMRDKIGKNVALSATLSSLLMYTRFKDIAYNLSSGITNFIDGQVANTISAASGNYFPHSYLHEVTPLDMFRSDIAKQFSPAFMSEKVAKAYYLARKMDMFQDNVNELQKASSNSPITNMSKFAPNYNMGKSEQYNQMPVIVATLKDEMIFDKDGEKSSVWDAMEAKYDENTKQWEATLKSNFATEENKQSWEQFNGRQYFDYKSKARQVIRDTHSHGLDPTAGMMAKVTILGQALTMFKTFLPREYYKRYAVEQDNIAAGIKGFKGRYRSHTEVSAAIQGGLTGSLFFGLPGFIAGSFGGAILGSKYGITSASDVLSQTLTMNKILFKKLMGMPINPIGRLLTGKTLIDTTIHDDVNDKFKFSTQDFANFKANMQSMSTQLAYMGLLFLTKAIFWDDKDKSNDLRRETHNLLANRLMTLAGASNLYLNPIQTGSTTLSIPILQLFTNIGKTLGAVDKFMKGEDTLISGPNAGHSRLLETADKTFLPAIGTPWAGLKGQAQRQYESSPLDDYFHNDEHDTAEQLKEKKSARRAELDSQLQDTFPDDEDRHREIVKIMNKEFPRAKSTSKSHLALYPVTN